MLDLDALNVEEIANALAEQTDHEHRWLINPMTGCDLMWYFAKHPSPGGPR